MKRSDALKKVERGSLCSGCGLCEGVTNGAVELRSQAPGYLRPVQVAELTDEQERRVAEACPGLKVEPWGNPGTDGTTDTYWGPIRDCSTGFATDETMRFRCSSGGAVSALAAYALESGLVEKVVHIAASEETAWENRTVVSRTVGDVLNGAGSRYAPSAPLVDIETILNEGERAVFIGKPCDVSALRRLGRLDPRVDEIFPIKLSFFCGGVPSFSGAEAIVRELGFDPEQVERFQYRGEGWPGVTTVDGPSGKREEMTYENSWGRFLSPQVQFRCKICPDSVGGVADIACADAWYGGESGYPQFDEAPGRSLILARTPAGERLLADAVAKGRVEKEPLPIREIDLMQPAQARRKRLIGARMAAWRIAGRPVPKMDGLLVEKARRNSAIPALLKEFAGTMRRIVQGRI